MDDYVAKSFHAEVLGADIDCHTGLEEAQPPQFQDETVDADENDVLIIF